MHFSPIPRLAHQLHYRLKEVDVKTSYGVDAIQRLESFLRAISVVANGTPDHLPVLLLHMAVIILLVRAGAGKLDAFPLTVTIRLLVNKLDSAVRVHPF